MDFSNVYFILFKLICNFPLKEHEQEAYGFIIDIKL